MNTDLDEVAVVWDIDILEWMMWYRHHILHARPTPGPIQTAVYSTSNTGHRYEASFIADGHDHLLKLVDLSTQARSVLRVRGTGNDDWAAPTVRDLVTIWRNLHPAQRNAVALPPGI